MDYKKFCLEVFKLDKKIRYVGIFYKNFSVVEMREGLQNLLSSEETRKSLEDTNTRWKIRESLKNKLGKPLYAMAEYEKVKRITIPIGNEGIILISIEPSLYHEIITKEILQIRDRYLSLK